MKNPLIMHVNYCEQGQTFEEICRKAVDWGFDGVEFRRAPIGSTIRPEEYVDLLAKGIEASGLKHVLFGYPTADLMNPDADYRKKQIEGAVEFYHLASKRFPIYLCNALAGVLQSPDKSVTYSEYDKNGSAAATEDHWEWAAEGFKILGATAEELGFKFAFETHMCYLHDIPSAAIKLVRMIDHPAVGVNLDFGNIVYFKEHPTLEETISLLSDRIYYVHLKNSVTLPTGGRMPSTLADGEINHREYLRLLRQISFDGPICIEAPRPGDREWFAQQDYAYIKTVISDMGM